MKWICLWRVGQKKRTEAKFGTWMVEGDLSKIKYRNERQDSKDWEEQTIVLLTEDELYTKIKGSQNIVKYTGIT